MRIGKYEKKTMVIGVKSVQEQAKDKNKIK